MASALSFLVNDNPRQDVSLLDSFINPYIFDQLFQTHMGEIIKNSTEITIDAHYNLRPDLLSFESYGTNFWYPAILVANKLGSLFQFKAEYLNNRCLVPSYDIIQELSIRHRSDILKKIREEKTI